MFDQILAAVKTLADSQTNMAISHGAVPQNNGLAMYPGPGYTEERYLDRGGIYEIPIVLNGKHNSLQTLLSALSNIHWKLTTKKEYPKADDWQILSIETSTAPNYIDRENSDPKQWLYGSILSVKFYCKGVS